MDENLKKSNLKSDKLRNDGNQFYAQKKFFEALLKYNESLCFAEDDEHLALVYANRSAVYIETKMYQQCLNNIRLAKEHNYPEEKLVKLLERETRCLELIMQASSINSEPFDFFKLSYKANPKIPFIIDDLELKTNAKYGRHIITKRDLKVGDIITIEDSFFSSLQTNPYTYDLAHPTNKFNFCNLCCKESYMDLIPCSGCVTTMFCDKKCQEKARSHQYFECFLESSCKASPAQSSYMKMFFKSMIVMNGSITELEKLFNECLKSPKTVFDFDFSDKSSPDYDKNLLRCALSLAKHEAMKTLPIVTENFFADHPYLKKAWKSHKKFIKQFLLHLLQVNHLVSSPICQYSAFKAFKVNMGRSNNLVGSLINHSCSPNIAIFELLGETSAIVVIRPIAAGEQIFQCYCEPFFASPKHERQTILEPYNFKCDCEACKDPIRYGVLDNLKVVEKSLLQLAVKTFTSKPINLEKDSNLKGTIEDFTKIVRKMQRSYRSQQYPSLDYVIAINSLLKTFEHLARETYFH